MNFLKLPLQACPEPLQRTNFTKHILLLVVMFLVKFSFAQTEITSDSLKIKSDSVSINAVSKVDSTDIKNKLAAEKIKMDSIAASEASKTAAIEASKAAEELAKTKATADSTTAFTNAKEAKEAEDAAKSKADADSTAAYTAAQEAKAKTSTDTVKHETTTVQSILEAPRQSKASKRVDTVFLLEIAKPALTESSATFDAGQTFSTFKFTDSKGNSEKDFSNNITGCFSLGYQYVKKSGLFIRSNVGMRKAGASLIFDGLDINWTIQYADANLGIGYISNKWRVKPYFSVSPYFAYMLKANETIGMSNVDIKKDKSFKTSDFGVFISPGLRIALTNSVAFYAEYKYILGLQNIETATDQKAYNRGSSINLGISFTIEKLRLPSPTVLPKNGHKVKNFMKNKEEKTESAN